jgi:DNA-binding IclR family transcriptional regulator
MFGGTQVIDTSRVGANTNHLQYGRGRPRRLWRGAAPKAIMAFLPRSRLQRIHQANATEFANAAMGHSWEDFRRLMMQIRRKGIYVSHGELDPQVSAAAVPLLNDEGEVLGALSLVGMQSIMKQLTESKLRDWLSQAASEITSQLSTPQ